jgi:hypothetical protein
VVDSPCKADGAALVECKEEQVDETGGLRNLGVSTLTSLVSDGELEGLGLLDTDEMDEGLLV